MAAVEYTPSEVAPFPAQMMDVKAAIRYMKANADKYNIDLNKVFVMGDSSGGHTSLMAGFTTGIDCFEEDKNSEYDSSVNGIIDMYGPVNIALMNEELSVQNHIEPDSPEGYLIGRKNVLENPELVKPTIVTNYISGERETPPVLIFHGTNDELVAFGQSCILYDRLKECGKRARFYAMEGSNHGGSEFWSEEVMRIIDNFIKKDIL